MTIRIKLHPPERRRRTVTLPAFGCCSCCCCCCLHTIGGIIAAAAAGRRILKKSPPPPSDPDDERAWARRAQHGAPVRLYWSFLAVSCVLMLAISTASLPSENPMNHLLVGLILLPAAQIAAGLLSSAWVALISRHPDKPYCHGVVWKITGWAFLGAVLGLLAMLPLLAVCK